MIIQLGELISIGLMATALGMDAFSVSLGLGMQPLRLKRIGFIGIMIGITHMIMPLMGILLGLFISVQIGQYTAFVGGLLLTGIGAHMLFSAFHQKAVKLVKTSGIGLLIFAISVSMDSFSVGLSLGISEVRAMIVIFVFGFVSMVLTWTGLLVGRKVHGLLGVYSEILGGSILIVFGLRILFG